jgi:hypothetical protein
MSYKGTFGSEQSSTGGDLPASGVLDGDIFIADSDYYSAVADISFSAGEWAIYTGTEWSNVPMAHPSTAPVGAIIPYAGVGMPKNYLPCDGYQIKISDYQTLYSAIGTLYDSGAEPAGYFSIPDYNTSGYFLQGGAVPGQVIRAGLPNITGWVGVDRSASYGGAFAYGGQSQGAGSSSPSNIFVNFDASISNAIYGSSDTVQPPAITVIFLIKYL